MQTFAFTDHTQAFKLLLAKTTQNPASFSNDDDNNNNNDNNYEINFVIEDKAEDKVDVSKTVRVKDQTIENIIVMIDARIVDLKAVIANTSNFSVTIEEQCVLFKKHTDAINRLATELLNSINVYKKKEPLMHRYYILILKDKFQKILKISAKFQGNSIIASELEKLAKINKNADDTLYNHNHNHNHNQKSNAKYNYSYGQMDNQNFDPYSEEQMQQQQQQQQQELSHLQNVLDERTHIVSKLNDSIQDLYDVSLKFNIIISEQGELIERIDNNIISTLQHTEKGINELNEAKKHHKTGKKIKRGALAIAAIAVVTTVISATAKFTHNLKLH
jgi:hypothetical protein